MFLFSGSILEYPEKTHACLGRRNFSNKKARRQTFNTFSAVAHENPFFCLFPFRGSPQWVILIQFLPSSPQISPCPLTASIYLLLAFFLAASINIHTVPPLDMFKLVWPLNLPGLYLWCSRSYSYPSSCIFVNVTVSKPHILHFPGQLTICIWSPAPLGTLLLAASLLYLHPFHSHM